mgnify:CR=1 FL=1|tara:strand:+ start:51772 stop:52878 length:1107 start_codon:yes stop_codon:yes gene_type:complete
MSHQILERIKTVAAIVTWLLFFLTSSFTWAQPMACISLFTNTHSLNFDSSTLEPNTPSAIEGRIQSLQKEIKDDPTVYSNLEVIPDSQLQTLRVKAISSEFAADTGLRPGTEAFLLFMPGIGGENSYLTSVLSSIGSYNKNKLSSTLKKVNQKGLLVKTTAEGLELPGRTGAIDPNQVATIKDFVAWYEAILLQIKSEIGPDTPIVLVGRSGSGSFSWIVQSMLNKKYGKGFVGGSVAINPVLTDTRTLPDSEKALEMSDAQSTDHSFVFKELDRWSYALYWEAARSKEILDLANDGNFMLVMLSKGDDQILKSEVGIYKDIAKTNENFVLREFDTDKHDIIRFASDNVRLEANLELFSFLGRVIEGN